MSTFWRLIQGLFPRILTDAERDEAFLAESLDRHDLEWRMREVDRRHHRAAIGGLWNANAH